MSSAAGIRLTNLDKRNRKLRDAFYQRYTRVPRASKPDRDGVVAQLSEEFFLSSKTVEKVLYAGKE